MERIVDQIQTTPDRWFLNLHTGHTIEGVGLAWRPMAVVKRCRRIPVGSRG